MPIRLPNSREPGATPTLLIKENIFLGTRTMEIYKDAKFYRKLRTTDLISKIIRECNGTLGMAGNFKNGCLYREYGLDQFWKKGNNEKVVCDHAIPVAELVRLFREDNVEIEKLIFSPVVRITKQSDSELTKSGFAKQGMKPGYPLYRYSHINMQILTHKGDEIDPAKWTEEDHWNLIQSTEELVPILRELEVS